MKYVAVCVVAGALIVSALLISMGSNEGCLPWQTPYSTASGGRHGHTECR